MAKSIFWLVFVVAIVVFIAVAMLLFGKFLVDIGLFEKFLGVTVPVLVFVAGICWALRTANVHQYSVMERNVQTYIWLYNAADKEMKRSYKQIIKNYDTCARADLYNAKMFSYLTYYISFSAVFIFVAEIFNLIFYGISHHWCLHQYHCVRFIAIGFSILSLSFFIFACISLMFACISLMIRIFHKEDEFKECLALSSRLANFRFLPFLQEDWIYFYRKEPKEQKKDLNKLKARQKEFEKEKEFRCNLGKIIYRNDWLEKLLLSDKDC